MVEVKTTKALTSEYILAPIASNERESIGNKRWVCLDSVGSGFPEKEFKAWIQEHYEKTCSNIPFKIYSAESCACWGFEQGKLVAVKEREDLENQVYALKEINEELKAKMLEFADILSNIETKDGLLWLDYEEMRNVVKELLELGKK